LDRPTIYTIAIQYDLPVARADIPGCRFDHRGFAGAIRADNAEDFARLNSARKVFQSRDLTELYGQIADSKSARRRLHNAMVTIG
jgi:hypothetical protein